MFTLFTIGFTKKTAEQFFELLKENGVKEIVDIRINNTSQLAGFAKSPDLAYFAKSINKIGYRHVIDFAPTKELLSDYQNKRIDRSAYQKKYMEIIKQRKIISKYDIKSFDGACFLCSEDLPAFCHRKLLTDYFKENYNDLNIVHLI